MIRPNSYDHLRGTLTGISDRMLDAHLKLYQGYVETLNAIQSAYPMTDWGQAAAGAPAPLAAVPILGVPVASLDLRAVGPLADALAVVRREFDAKGFPPEAWPAFYLGDEDFWTTDKGTSINVPWYLANPLLWRLSNQATSTRYSFEQALRCLRHELGHAIFFAYELGSTPPWQEMFGNSNDPYKDSYNYNPMSQEHVHYLTGVTAHYPQKHPEEDWAEAFARWLDADGDWRAEFATWPFALKKLEYIETVFKPLFQQVKPTNAYRGRPTPYKSLKGTVADRLGIPRLVQPFTGQGWSEHSELLRREPYYMNAVALHELYFENLGGPGTNLTPLVFDQASIGWGSWDSYMLDFRAMMGSTGGWALTVWDTRNGCLKNILVEQHHIGVAANCPVVLAVDCWEHAYAMDYGIRKDLYIGAALKNINWDVVEGRLARAIGGSVALVPVAPSARA